MVGLEELPWWNRPPVTWRLMQGLTWLAWLDFLVDFVLHLYLYDKDIKARVSCHYHCISCYVTGNIIKGSTILKGVWRFTTRICYKEGQQCFLYNISSLKSKCTSISLWRFFPKLNFFLISSYQIHWILLTFHWIMSLLTWTCWGGVNSSTGTKFYFHNLSRE